MQESLSNSILDKFILPRNCMAINVLQNLYIGFGLAKKIPMLDRGFDGPELMAKTIHDNLVLLHKLP